MKHKYITVHCSATQPKNDFSVDKLRASHVDHNKWSDIGYHFYITTDGETHHCRPLKRSGAHVKGHNDNNIGICLEGGLNNDTGRADDTYNSHQMNELYKTIRMLKKIYDITDDNIKGHRDWFPDLNGDGIIDKRDWLKDCPCFDVKKWLKGNK